MDQRIGTPDQYPPPAVERKGRAITGTKAAGDAAVCWLYRAAGLPGDNLRHHVVNRHGLACDWCDYPADVLLGWIRDHLATLDLVA